MPVKAVGKRIVEVRTGRTVATASSKKNAQASARIRNAATKKK